MITYVYRYTDVPDEIEQEYCDLLQSIKDDPYTEHPENGRPIERSFHGCNPTVLISPGEFNTFAGVASKNTERMQKEGDPRVAPKEDKTPWWRKGKKKAYDPSNKTPQQVERYIREGKE